MLETKRHDRKLRIHGLDIVYGYNWTNELYIVEIFDFMISKNALLRFRYNTIPSFSESFWVSEVPQFCVFFKYILTTD